MENNRHWQNNFKSSIRDSKSLLTSLKESSEHFKAFEQELQDGFNDSDYPLFIPREVVKEILRQKPYSPLWNQFIPSAKEIREASGLIDPIGDQENQVAPQFIHRYKTRALFTPTTICPINCRYCFRKNELNHSLDLFKNDFEATLSYLKEHPEIQEIIFTGGDPLTLGDERIKFYLTEFSKIPHLKFIRFHSRFPISMPTRITQEFLEIIKSFKSDFSQIHFVLHINHKDELNEENQEAIKKLSQVGSLLSQSVLLKEVNNSKEVLLNLFNALIDLNIRPYYLHHPDQAKGTSHFQLSLEEGRRLYAQLRDELPGWALPQYIIDIPGGSGKVSAFNPESYTFSNQLINRNGEVLRVDIPMGNS